MSTHTKDAINAWDDTILERQWDQQHQWPDALLVDGHDIGKEWRDKVRALNTARQKKERVVEVTLPDPTEDDIHQLQEELETHDPTP